MDDNFWAESDCSVPGERKALRRKCGLKWKEFHFRSPNRGRYDITQQRAVTVRKIASALFWFCPGRKKLDVADEPQAENSNYLNAEETLNEGKNVLVPNHEAAAEPSLSRTFTKNVFRRKYRPSLSNIRSLFEPYESFLKAVSNTTTSAKNSAICNLEFR